MGRILIGLLVLVFAGFIADETGWKIDQAHVRGLFDQKVASMHALDQDAVCKGMASDYRMSVRIYEGDELVEEDELDAESACAQARESLQLLKTLHERTRGLFAIDCRFDLRSIKVAPGGRSVKVEYIVTAKLGTILVSRSHATETWSRAFWRIRSHGGSQRIWTYEG